MGIFLENSKKFKVFVDSLLYKLPSINQADCTHEYNSIIIVPTCTSQGYTKYSCIVCGHTYTGNNTPMLDHTIVTIPGYAATPTTPGLTDGKKCGACGLVIQEQVEIPVAHSHTADYKTENRIEATCTTNGSYDSVKYCTVCLEELSRTPTTIPATGHTEGSPVIENRTESTCTSKGGYDTVVYCTKCNTELRSTHTELPLADHDWGDWVIDKNPTETTTGSKHRDCDNCDERDTETIPVLGHTHTAGTAQREDEVEAGCETDGSYNLVVRCTSCNNILSSTPQVIPALGHDYDPCECSRCNDTNHDWDPCECSKCEEVLHGTELPYATVHPTCTQDGQSGGTYCSDCKIQFTPPEVIPATGHTEVVIEATMPTCTTTGLTLGKYCSVCGVVTIQQYVVPATNHPTPIIDHAVEPTCTDSGLTQGTHCYDCGVILTAQQVVPALGHNMQSNNDYQAPTCSEPGRYTSYYCANGCGHTSGGGEIPATGKHTNGAAVQENYVPATCVGNGGYDTVMYCLKCGEETSRVPTVIYAPGHSMVTTPGKDATCTSPGYTTERYCSVCGFVEWESEEIPAKGHTLVDGCHCDTCGEDFHEFEMDTRGEAPTCGTSGTTDHYACKHCGAEYGGETIPATGNHVYNNWDDCYCNNCMTYVHEWDGDECSRCGEWAPWYDDNTD